MNDGLGSPADSVPGDPTQQPIRATVDEALAIAMDFHKSGQLDQAAYVYRTILSAVPEHVESLNFLGVLQQQKGDVDAGAVLIEKAVAIRPDYVDAQNNLGNVLRIQGKLDEAEATYRRAIELVPGHAEAHNNLGVVLRNQRRLDEAEQVLRRTLELQPERGDTYCNLGNVLDQQRRHAEAIDAYQAAIRLMPSLVDAYDSLGRLLGRAGKKAEAAQVYQQLLEQMPGNPVAQHMLAALSGDSIPQRASDQYVTTTFDTFADSFDYVLKELEYRAPHLVARVLGDLRQVVGSPFDLLDAGCGTGLCGPLTRPFARHLKGIDLSPRMLERARLRGVYDDLEQAEITEYLRRQSSCFDVILCADTLVYFGDLREVVGAAAGALREGGHLVFTLEDGSENCGEAGYSLLHHGRYCHDETFVRRVLAEAGFRDCQSKKDQLRLESGNPVAGLIVSARIESSQ